MLIMEEKSKVYSMVEEVIDRYQSAHAGGAYHGMTLDTEPGGLETILHKIAYEVMRETRDEDQVTYAELMKTFLVEMAMENLR